MRIDWPPSGEGGGKGRSLGMNLRYLYDIISIARPGSTYGISTSLPENHAF